MVHYIVLFCRLVLFLQEAQALYRIQGDANVSRVKPMKIWVSYHVSVCCVII